MDSYAFELYPSTSQKSTLTQVVSDIEHFAHRHPSTVYSSRKGYIIAIELTEIYQSSRSSGSTSWSAILLYLWHATGYPTESRRRTRDIQPILAECTLDIAYIHGPLLTESSYSGPCVPSRLLWTSSNHSDRSLNPVSSFSDAGPGASASKFDSSVQDDQNTNSGTHVYGLHNNAIITSQTPGPRRPVDSPKRRHTEIYRDEGTSAMLPQSERGNNTGKLQLKCGLCPNFFVASKGDLKRHLESLAHKKPSYICEGCDRKFTREDALKRHKLHTCPPSSKKATKTIGGK
ncbi:hypothetical protein BJ912DRAFT_1125846 [Pholiota molesta]|nr:hypothetical protein BJ912DRAFT_1125846 [Pholiota molesta]